MYHDGTIRWKTWLPIEKVFERVPKVFHEHTPKEKHGSLHVMEQSCELFALDTKHVNSTATVQPSLNVETSVELLHA